MSIALATFVTGERNPLASDLSTLTRSLARFFATAVVLLTFQNFVSNHQGGKKYVRNKPQQSIRGSSTPGATRETGWILKHAVRPTNRESA